MFGASKKSMKKINRKVFLQMNYHNQFLKKRFKKEVKRKIQLQAPKSIKQY